MKPLFFILSIFTFIGCSKKQEKSNLADVNIIVTANFKIDSLQFSNISQTKWYTVKSKDTLKLHLDKPLNDLYNFWFYTESGKIRKQVWLDGEKVVITGTIDKTFEIDTVTNSALFYVSKDYVNQYNELKKSKSNQSVINKFILEKIRENIHNPFSLALVNSFLHQNENNKEQILELKNTLEKRNNLFKDHFLNIDERIESLLKIKNININQYNFYNRKNDTAHISLKKNKFYLLDFWFLNCPPCVQQHKEIAEGLDFLSEKNVEILGISKDENHSEWSDYLNQNKYNWRNFRENSNQKKLTSQLSIEAFPTYYLIDSKGKIAANFSSFSEVKNYLETNSLNNIK
ncbi:TlpA family protein disulfide reductase [Tenacibaculum sp. MEBiC06402]|uniref:TlpA family protein disulfide reductase n=1 Tax=unclassified Tenacibaculum TaxID=2635139 RepID=UPI003B9C127C